MNKHFEDARYYLKRAGEHAKEGVKEELEPIEERVREAVGREKETEPGGIEKIREDLKTVERRAEGEAKKAIEDARERLSKVSSRE